MCGNVDWMCLAQDGALCWFLWRQQWSFGFWDTGTGISFILLHSNVVITDTCRTDHCCRQSRTVRNEKRLFRETTWSFDWRCCRLAWLMHEEGKATDVIWRVQEVLNVVIDLYKTLLGRSCLADQFKIQTISRQGVQPGVELINNFGGNSELELITRSNPQSWRWYLFIYRF
jgi:hypothetical protein